MKFWDLPVRKGGYGKRTKGKNGGNFTLILAAGRKTKTPVMSTIIYNALKGKYEYILHARSSLHDDGHKCRETKNL